MRSSYRIGGLIIGSNVVLPGLTRADGDPRCTLALDTPGARRASQLDWTRRWRPWGRAKLSCAHEGSGFLLRFHGAADVYVSATGDEFRCHRRRGVSTAALARLFIDQALPLGLAAAGRHVLHASAVMTAAGAVAFLGETGDGKSTMAASLVAAGCGLLADDWMLVGDATGGLVAHAGSPTLKLRSDSARAALGLDRRRFAAAPADGAKARVDPAQSGWIGAAGTAALHRVYLLQPDAAPHAQLEVRPLSTREAFLALVTHSFAFDPTDPVRLRADAERFARLARTPIWFALRVPRRLECLTASHQMLVA